jgi:ABC-2 type transport system ATP-binding protein
MTYWERNAYKKAFLFFITPKTSYLATKVKNVSSKWVILLAASQTGGNPMETVISVHNLEKSYGAQKAVDGISFDVKKGTVFGLLGHNGAGKSTTLECILGTKTFEKGSVLLLGQSPNQNRKALFNRVGVQFQNAAYPNKIRVGEICEISSSLYKNAADWKNMLKEFGLSDKRKSDVSSLSGGERQKLDILLAVMHRPEVVFLDELTTGLDPLARRKVWQYIHALKNNGATVLLTSHYMDEVSHLCDRIAIMKHGKIIASGTVDQVIAQSGADNMDDAFIAFAQEEAV